MVRRLGCSQRDDQCEADAHLIQPTSTSRISASWTRPDFTSLRYHPGYRQHTGRSNLKTINSVLKKLTQDDLQQWAGAIIVSRARSYLKSVEELSYSDNRLVAYVYGSEQYLTWVSFSKKGIAGSSCSCPYWTTCKHAVAVVLAAAERVKHKQEIALLEKGDVLYDALSGDDEQLDFETYDELDNDDGVKKTKGEGKFAALLAEKSKEELVAFLLDIWPRYPDIVQELKDRERLKSSSADKLVAALKRDIKTVTSQSMWYDSWSHHRELPDYSRILRQLEVLLAKGHADALLRLGEELLQLGQRQIEQTNDEGETADAIASCMSVVLRGLPYSTYSRAEQLLWLVEHQLQDEFSLMDCSEELIKSRQYQPKDWAELADILAARLAGLPKKTDSYKRAGWVKWLLTAYERSHAQARIIPLLEQEAVHCNLQAQLVDALLAKGEKIKARQYCIEFYAGTINKFPGIAGEMQTRLRNMAQRDRQHALVAAYYAQDFFAYASMENFTLLQKASEKAACWPEIRSSVLVYLDTGARPDDKHRNINKHWPLPQPDVMPPADNEGRSSTRFPQLDLLIDIAIHERRNDDAVELFRQLKQKKRGDWFPGVGKCVAKAVASSHPQVALDIWREVVDRYIGMVKPDAYIEAATYLRLMRKTYVATRRLPEWNELLVDLRTRHKAKRRLLEVLDSLADNNRL